MVTFTTPAVYADLRILEYSGVDQLNPVDVTAAATGTNNSSNSGPVTTTNANDLIFAANVVATRTRGPGTGFTKRMITVPDGDIAEDRIVTTVGTYSGIAPLSGGGPWIMQMIAFKAASGGGTSDISPPTPPSNLLAMANGTNTVNLTWIASTDNVGVTNYLVERCQGAGCTSFAQVGTTAGTTYSDTGLLSGTSYSYRVRATDAAGNVSGYFKRFHNHHKPINRQRNIICPACLCHTTSSAIGSAGNICRFSNSGQSQCGGRRME